MEPYSSEQEQIDSIKRWWKDNGRSLVFGLVIGIAALAGYRYWDSAQTARAQRASHNYAALLQMLDAQRSEDARKVGLAIIEGYPDSTYARLSALLLAKLAADAGDYARARELLLPLSDAADSALSQLAHARLARIALAEGDTAAADAYLADLPLQGEKERFAELRADVRAAAGDTAGARRLYLEALAQAEQLGLERGVIQLKLDNLASGLAAGGS